MVQTLPWDVLASKPNAVRQAGWDKVMQDDVLASRNTLRAGRYERIFVVKDTDGVLLFDRQGGIASLRR